MKILRQTASVSNLCQFKWFLRFARKGKRNTESGNRQQTLLTTSPNSQTSPNTMSLLSSRDFWDGKNIA